MRFPIALAAVLLAASLAHAQSPGDRPRLFLSPMGEPFRQTNGAAAWFARADADADGRITPVEFQADALAFFRRLDENGDGVLDGFEQQTYERTLAPEITGVYFAEGGQEQRDESLARRPRVGLFGGGRSRAPYAAREGAGRFSHLNIPQPVAGADGDADRRVSQAEWRRAADQRFGLLDRLKAGALAREDLPPLPGEPLPTSDRRASPGPQSSSPLR